MRAAGSGTRGGGLLPETVVALLTAAVVLGPALAPGLVLAYDLAWPVTGRLTGLALGGDGHAPRAVPSDAVAALLASVLGGTWSEKAVLVAVLTGAGVGAGALARTLRPGAGRLASAAAVLAAVWNPYVLGRLALGHWTVLLGYAALPWALRATLRSRPRAFAAAVLVAGLGGANAWVVAVPVAAVAAALAWRWRGVLLAGLLAAGTASVWAVPSLASATRGDPAGFAVFAARADSRLGLLGSLLGGGGIWNPAGWAPERSGVLLAAVPAVLLTAGVVAVGVVAARGGRARWGVGVAAAAAAGLVLALASGLPWTAGAWGRLAAVPGAALVRDPQKLLAAWTVVGAAGAGLAVDRLRRLGPGGLVPAVALVLAGPLALPSMALGLGGRLRAVAVPADLLALERTLGPAPSGVVGVLPWNQYRRYPWNEDRISLSLVPRLLDRPVLFDDSLPLAGGVVEGEDPRAARVSRALESGGDPFAVLAAEGAGVVVVERATGGPEVPPAPAGWRLLGDGPTVRVLVRDAPVTTPVTTPGRLPQEVGWGLFLTAWAVLLGDATRHTYRRVPESADGC